MENTSNTTYAKWLGNALNGGEDHYPVEPGDLVGYFLKFNNEIDVIIERHGIESGGIAISKLYGFSIGDIYFALRSTPLAKSLQVLDSVKVLYSKGFMKYCSKENFGSGYSKLQFACDMLWDMDCLEYAVRSDEQLLIKAHEVLEYALYLPNEYCQSSAIHGLGHMTHKHKDLAQPILQSYINSGVPTEGLKRYATMALTGAIM